MSPPVRERRRSRREREELVEAAEEAAAPGRPPPPHLAAALRLQQSAGNAAVSRLLQRQGGAAAGGGSASQLRLDSEIEAEIRRIELERLLRSVLDPEAIGRALRDLDLPTAGPPPWLPRPGETPPAQPQPAVPRGAGPETPREATAGDLGDAVAAVPAVREPLDELKTQAVEQAARDWRRLSGGERALLITSGALIAGGALGGALANEESRSFLLGRISGRELPVPGVDGLNVAFTLQRENVGVMFTLDVGRLLPKSAGF